MASGKPIVRLLFVKMKQAFHELSQEDRTAFMRKDRENLDSLGMSAVTMVDCRWSTEDWDFIGVEEWPSLESLEARGRFEKEQLQTSKYIHSKVFVGSPVSFVEYGKDT